MYRLSVSNLAKRFGPRKVFAGLEFELKTGQAMAIVGCNGSGKSTLLKTILGLIRPTKGKVEFSSDEGRLDESGIRKATALVAPYLNLYDQLTAEENLKFFATVSGENVTGKSIDELLGLVGLQGRGSDLVGEYSSGMKQRLKYATALLTDPAFLFLDEPTANLDDAGKKIVLGIIEEYRSRSIIAIATNEKEEYSLAEKQVLLGE